MSNDVGNTPRTNKPVRSVGAVKSTAPYRGHRPLNVIHKPIRMMVTLVAKRSSAGTDQPDSKQYDGTGMKRTLRPPH